MEIFLIILAVVAVLALLPVLTQIASLLLAAPIVFVIAITRWLSAPFRK